MARKVDKYFKIRTYKYAPEMTTVTFNNLKLNLNPSILQEIGKYMVIGKTKEASDVLKRYIRKESNLREKIAPRIFSWLTTDGQDIYIPNHFGLVDMYDINRKLDVYKVLKRSLEENDYRDPIEVKKCTLDGYFNPIDVKDDTSTLVMSKRVRLV